MATYVLVHGAHHGGWCWKRVTPFLRSAGHEVFTPTLTGLGERAHLLTPEIDLDTHIQDIINVLAYEDLEQVILVGHSYGGLIVTGVADRAMERLAHLVYLDSSAAASQEDGVSQNSLMGPAAAAVREERVRSQGEGWRLPPPPIVPGVFGVAAEADLQWLRAKVGPHPYKTYHQPLRLTNTRAKTLPRTYIYCTADKEPGSSRDQWSRQMRTQEGWRYRELATGHDAMILAPRELADLLLELA